LENSPNSNRSKSGDLHLSNSPSFDINPSTAIKNKKTVGFKHSLKKWEKTNLYINDKVIDFGQKDNNITKRYETFNVVADDDDGNSIHAADIEELASSEGGRVFISEDKIKDFVNQLLEQRLGSSLK
jgi:hypothetical protein